MSNSNILSSNAKMSVSGILHRNNTKSICIMLEDNGKSIEVRMPDEEILANSGYNEADVTALIEYLREIYDELILTAKGINPMKAFMR